MRYVKTIVWTFILVTSNTLKADPLSAGWNVLLDCPSIGSVFSSGDFETSNTGGFDASGRCSRTASKYTRLEFYGATGGTLLNSVVHAVHTGDVLITPPLLNTEYEPNYTVSTSCPISNRSMRFIVAGWGQGARTIDNELVTGTANYSMASGISVTNLYDVNGTVLSTFPISIPGSCTGGEYPATGSGDRGGTVFLTEVGAGVFKTLAEHTMFFLPEYTVNPAIDLSSIVASGMMFDSQGSGNTHPVRAMADGPGTTIQLKTYSDVDAGTIDGAANYDELVISVANSPSNGILLGVVTRKSSGGGSLGTGNVSCIAYKGVNLRMICSGENPSDNSYPYSFAFTVEGSQVLGQASAYSSTIERVYGNANDAFSDGTRLFVVDPGGFRVLIYNTIPTDPHQYADVVVGQSSLVSGSSSTPSQTVFQQPWRGASDGTRLVVVDQMAHRVLIWNTIPSRNKAPADLVLGQPDFDSVAENHGAGYDQPDSQSFFGPSGAAIVGNKLLVADSGNNRILIWNTWPTVNQQASDLVIGQANMTSQLMNYNGTLAAKANGFNNPENVSTDGTRMLVSDAYNNRIVIFSTIPVASGASGNIAVGASSLTVAGGGLSQNRFSQPAGAWSDGTRLYVADISNARVMMYDSIPTAHNANATRVLGQLNFTTTDLFNSDAPTSQNMSAPRAVSYGGGKLFVSDAQYSRVTVWDGPPSSTGQDADYVLGQANFTTNYAAGFAEESVLANPKMSWSNGAQFFVVDQQNNRVLMWNSRPTKNQQGADVVIGQTSMAAGPQALSQTQVAGPTGVAATATKVYVVDQSNNRVLGWNSIPTGHGQPADFVLGQPDFDTSDCNLGATSATTLCYPGYVAVDAGHLYVSDGMNRVLIWNHHPSTTQEPADIVLGQADMSGEMANGDGASPPTASTLYYAQQIYSDGTHLVVADTGNSRVLVWNTIPVSNGQPADVVIGQPDMVSGSANNPSLSAQGLSIPWGVLVDNGMIFITDTDNNRLLVYNSIPTTNHQAADAVFGQADFVSRVENYGGLSERSLAVPIALSKDGSTLYITDSWNQRILSLEVE